MQDGSAAAVRRGVFGVVVTVIGAVYGNRCAIGKNQLRTQGGTMGREPTWLASIAKSRFHKEMDAARHRSARRNLAARDPP